MLRILLSQIRHRRGRVLALFLGVLVATTGFTVLASSTETSRLRVTGTVDENYRAAYDILVRPPGSRVGLEQQRGLVRPNYLSGQFGGISLAQYEQIKHIPGIEVAAPIAMVGYTTAEIRNEVDVTDAVDRSQASQVLRLRPTWIADRGLTKLTDDAPRYVYVTTRRVAWPLWGVGSTDQSRWTDGRDHTSDVAACGSPIPSPVELRDDGTAVPICTTGVPQPGQTGLRANDRRYRLVVRLLPDGRFDYGPTVPTGERMIKSRLTVSVPWPMSLLLAAVDPEQESKLVGLDAAVVDGSPLSQAGLVKDIPVLAPSRLPLDERLQVHTDRFPGASLAGGPADQEVAALTGQSMVAGPSAERTAAQVYAAELDQGIRAQLQVVVQSGQPSYVVRSDGSLVPRTVTVDPEAVWAQHGVSGIPVPWFARDSSTRPLTRVDLNSVTSGQLVWANTVGVFDPQRLRGFSPLSAVPLETYQAPEATGADQRSRSLLQNQPLQPNSNPGGYLASPPLMLTRLDALPQILTGSQRAEPISAIRVRVAGLHGLDNLSQERVRQAAERIATTTGLDVDITVGASPAPQVVTLDAGRYGRPVLRLLEDWSQKGVAVAVIRAVDRKSALLLLLILLVCSLFLGNAVSAAVKDRRRELAMLSCLGWPPTRLFAAIFGEVVLIGLTAGVTGAVITLPLGSAAGLRVVPAQAWLAVPAGLSISALAAVVPAMRAARTYPAEALQRSARAPSHGTHRVVRRLPGLAAVQLGRTPGRTLLAVSALTVSLAGAAAVSAVIWRFHGTVTGTLLGDAVSMRSRDVDVVAVTAAVLLGFAAVADVMYLGVRERATELATLQATGWSPGAVARLTAYEGLGIGMLGGVAGIALGLAAVTTFAGTSPGMGLLTLGLAAALGVAAAMALLGAALTRLVAERRRIAPLLAEE